MDGTGKETSDCIAVDHTCARRSLRQDGRQALCFPTRHPSTSHSHLCNMSSCGTHNSQGASDVGTDANTNAGSFHLLPSLLMMMPLGHVQHVHESIITIPRGDN